MRMEGEGGGREREQMVGRESKWCAGGGRERANDRNGGRGRVKWDNKS